MQQQFTVWFIIRIICLLRLMPKKDQQIITLFFIMKDGIFKSNRISSRLTLKRGPNRSKRDLWIKVKWKLCTDIIRQFEFLLMLNYTLGSRYRSVQGLAQIISTISRSRYRFKLPLSVQFVIGPILRDLVQHDKELRTGFSLLGLAR